MDLRQHNDRNFIWHILAKGPKGTTAPYDLTGKELLVEIEINRRTVITIDDFEVDGNTLSFVWYGKDQRITGPFRIILTENPGAIGEHQIDEAGPFRLVASNAEIRDRNCPPNIEVEAIELTSVVAVFDDSSIPVTVARKTWVNGVLEENYYTKAAVDLKLAGKQDTIDDLAAIRLGAAAGATAVQPEAGKGLSHNDYSDAEKAKLAGIAAGAQVNILEGVKVNGTDLVINGKKVDVQVPTKTSDLTNDSDFTTNAIVQAALAIINAVIPVQASADNQLADKNFVNSSITTATAEFRGTYMSPGMIPTTGVDLNDYAFVMSADEDGNTLYSRYKFNGTQWIFEFTINNSYFTAAQWATVNSGMTLALVEKLQLLPTKQQLDELFAGKQNVIQDLANLTDSIRALLMRDLGYNAEQAIITLVAGEQGKYVKCATRAAENNASFTISQPFDVEACSELLIKTGFNPSDPNHAPLDLSVIAIYEEMERTRTVQKKDGGGNPLYYVVTVDPETGTETVTSEESTVVSDFPVYTTETYIEHRYLPNNEDRFVKIPDSGYYIANIPQSCKCVISYKPGVTDLNVLVRKHGALANLTSQIFGIYEHRVMSEAVVNLAARVEALEALIRRPGNISVGVLDFTSLTKFGYPAVLFGQGAPSASVRPFNLAPELPWDGIPAFLGQLYIDVTAATRGLWHAKDSTAVSDWIND